ncbi:hypothetical protein [Krasilnikovia sp. M28-CT-15]|uniref:hypothetical protein n=1 Tax=Krasilnikovia sp. M28-CT-15 TaxID=3373540 RepID=UPI003876EF00
MPAFQRLDIWQRLDTAAHPGIVCPPDAGQHTDIGQRRAKVGRYHAPAARTDRESITIGPVEVADRIDDVTPGRSTDPADDTSPSRGSAPSEPMKVLAGCPWSSLARRRQAYS